MESLFTQSVDCPYCGEYYNAVIDASQGDIEYTEDCYICCRPIIFALQWTDQQTLTATTHREDD